MRTDVHLKLECINIIYGRVEKKKKNVLGVPS